jgi:acetyl-CoA carboxylase carboxyltransferase component
MDRDELKMLRHRAAAGGEARYHEKNGQQGKLFARQRIERLLDLGSFVEDGLLANSIADGLSADGVITGLGRVAERTVAIMANDSTVKAGSWGERTVEKILRIQETALRLRCPLLYLVDSAGARITDQIRMFPGRRGAGRIFFNQVTLSGQVPQLALLFGPSAAGGAYIPAFCDVVVMVRGNASMYLGSPRMAEMVIGEQASLEEMGGAQMHAAVSGCADVVVDAEDEAIKFARRYLEYFPSNSDGVPPMHAAAPPKSSPRSLEEVVLADENKPFDMRLVLDSLVDEGSLLELKSQYARELITSLARIDGRVVGVIANQPKHLGGVLFVNSAEKAARFIQLCDAFGLPLVFLADVPGFMIGSKVERQGIIRAGARMIAAVSAATVPKVSVIVRKAYGAGLYAMCGPAFEPDACLALPTASIAVMGPQAAVNAVYYNRIQAAPEGPQREALVDELREAYRRDVDLKKLASELVVDAVIDFEEMRKEVASRLRLTEGRSWVRPRRKHMIQPM